MDVDKGELDFAIIGYPGIRNDPFTIFERKNSSPRLEIMIASRSVGSWILAYFKDLPDVIISSLDHFSEIIRSWYEDPCEPSGSYGTIVDHPPLQNLAGESQTIGDAQLLLDWHYFSYEIPIAASEVWMLLWSVC